jgi:hypothetical protein
MSVKTASSATPSSSTDSVRLPGNLTMESAVKLAISEDKPILLDYWTASIEKSALIGVRDTGEKLLVKSQDEYTSPIQKIYKTGEDYIIMTENSIYLVSTTISTRKIQ